MIVNKKLDRFRQWAGERMGEEIRTNTSEPIKNMEQEMELRQQSMEKLQNSMGVYMKAVNKRAEISRQDNKSLPIAHLGSTMINQGDVYEVDSPFGQCLTSFGRTQERLAREQETYIVAAQDTWVESLQRSNNKMKELSAARKKLESRRLAYDTSLVKMQKAKREDFRVEEELRSQQLKYEDAEAEVERQMYEIRESEDQSVIDLTAFMEAQLAYHNQCTEVLLKLQQNWPVQSQSTPARATKPAIRSRSNTVRSFMSVKEEEEAPAPRPKISSVRSASGRQLESPTFDENRARPGLGRSTTYQTTASMRRDLSPVETSRLSRIPSDPQIQLSKSNLRHVSGGKAEDVFGDEYSDPPSYSESPGHPHSNGVKTPLVLAQRRAPPPPPPSRLSKPGIGKPAPPQPPAKRSLVS